MEQKNINNKLKLIGFYAVSTVFFGLQYFLAYLLDNKWYAYIFITLALGGLIYLRNKKKC